MRTFFLMLLCGAIFAADTDVDDGSPSYFFTLKASCPLIVSAGADLLITDWNDSVFPVGSIDAGVGGGKASAGIGWPGLGGYGYHSVKLGAIRTWGDPIWADKNATYVGVDYQISPVFYEISIGPYLAVSGEDSADFILSVSIGFQY